MAKQCGDGCHVICDFCIYYMDNGSDDDFHGEGVCLKTNKEVSCAGGCDDFECFNYREDNE